ncbi:cadherin repeat domain-containing protein, partial [Vibrio sp. 10N.261.46.F12]
MKYQLKILLDGQVNLIPLGGINPSETVPEGSVFTIVDEHGNQVTEGVVLKRVGEELEIEIDGEQVTVIEDFYTAEASHTTYLVEGTEEGEAITGGENESATEGVVWEAKDIANDNTFLGMSPLTASLVGAGIVAGGIIAGSSSSNSGNNPAVEPEPQSSYQVAVNPVAGVFTSSVLVELFDDTGALVGSKVHDMNTGPATFDIDNNYAGTLLAKITDTNGASGDYLDEATNIMHSLDTPLRVMLEADGKNDVTSTVSPLTELATRLAGISEAAPSVSISALTVNEKIADMFGLEDITSDVVTILETSFNEADGITEAEAYGKVLALLSGADYSSGSIDNTLNILEGEILETSIGDLGITANGFKVLTDAATAFESGANASTTEIKAGVIVDAPYLEVGENWLSSSEAQSNPTIKVSDVVAGDTVMIYWGTEQFSTTLTAGAIDSNGVASIQVPSTIISAEGNGQVEVQSQINGGLTSKALLLDVDLSSPTFVSGTTATLDENESVGSVVYKANLSDGEQVTFTLTGSDASFLSVNGTTGDVTLNSSPNHEVKSTYDFSLVATDSAGNVTTQPVVLTINNLDEVAPTLTSSSVATAIDENTTASTVIYTATADDSADISGGYTFALKGIDSELLNINSATGEVTLKVQADYEVKSTYNFEVVATDAVGNESVPYAVNLDINNLDEATPYFQKGSSITVSVDENSPLGTVIHTANALDSADISNGVTYALVSGASNFDIDSSTGEVKTKIALDHETTPSYTFEIEATDAAGHKVSQTVKLQLNDIDDGTPTITSGGTGSVDENAATSTVVYTATADDSADISGGVTFSLQGTDAAMFDINASTGDVTLKASADHESKSSYDFEVVATDSATNASTPQAVTITVNDLDEVAPTITSGGTGSVDENAATSTVVYTATADDSADISGGVTFSLQGTDAALFDINASTG